MPRSILRIHSKSASVLRCTIGGPVHSSTRGLTVFNGIAASLLLWTMIRPAILSEHVVLLALYYASYAFGGPGFSIPMALFMGGVCVPAAFSKLLPKWLIVLGLTLAVAGELSWFHLISPAVLFLIPLVRFPGFIWLIGSRLQSAQSGSPEPNFIMIR